MTANINDLGNDLAHARETSLTKLCHIMATLRSDMGCPWDRQQSPETLKPYILEEACELLEAIDSADPTDIQDELGDLLLQIVFLAQIFSEQKHFDMTDVIRSICEKMIRRHPHVFADATVAGHHQRWEQIKARENREKQRPEQLAARIPATLPALKRAQKLAKKTATPPAPELLDALLQQQQQLQKQLALANGKCSDHDNVAAMTSALGEILTLTVQLAASLDIDAEDTLRTKTTASIRSIDEEIKP